MTSDKLSRLSRLIEWKGDTFEDETPKGVRSWLLWQLFRFLQNRHDERVVAALTLLQREGWKVGVPA